MALKGKIISISGVDGCGKSTIIEALMAILEKQGKPCRYVWLRYNHYLTKVLLAFCRFAGFTKYEFFDGVRVGYHEFYRSRFISHIFIWTTCFDTLIASALLVYIPAFFSKKVIVCDRWVIDIMVDLETDTGIGFEPGKFYHKVFTGLLPRSSHNFIIDRDPELIRAARKENVHDKNFPLRVKLYRKHARYGYARVIDNNGKIADAVGGMMNDGWMHQEA